MCPGQVGGERTCVKDRDYCQHRTENPELEIVGNTVEEVLLALEIKLLNMSVADWKSPHLEQATFWRNHVAALEKATKEGRKKPSQLSTTEKAALNAGSVHYKLVQHCALERIEHMSVLAAEWSEKLREVEKEFLNSLRRVPPQEHLNKAKEVFAR